jgi:hypothetical protein
VKAWGLVRALGAQEADIAKIATSEEPYSRQRNSRLPSQASSDGVRHALCSVVVGYAGGECEQGLSLRRNLRIGQVVQHATRRTSILSHEISGIPDRLKLFYPSNCSPFKHLRLASLVH